MQGLRPLQLRLYILCPGTALYSQGGYSIPSARDGSATNLSVSSGGALPSLGRRRPSTARPDVRGGLQ